MSTDNIKIPCSIKHRFSDFIVNEIDENDTIVQFKPENDLQKWKKPNSEDITNGENQEKEEETKQDPEEEKS